MAGKRSPRYPRVSLFKAITLAKRLYDGAHQNKIASDTAAQVIGYQNSSSGAAAGALGALRQYGLVDGLRGDVGVSDLAMRILEPMDADEHIEALHEAANRPEVFTQILQQFGGELPKADAPITAMLVRQMGFSRGGATEVLKVLRDTLSELPDEPVEEDVPATAPTSPSEISREQAKSELSPVMTPATSTRDAEAILAFPLTPDCRAEVRFLGKVSGKAYERLIQLLNVLRETVDGE